MCTCGLIGLIVSPVPVLLLGVWKDCFIKSTNHTSFWRDISMKFNTSKGTYGIFINCNNPVVYLEQYFLALIYKGQRDTYIDMK